MTITTGESARGHPARVSTTILSRCAEGASVVLRRTATREGLPDCELLLGHEPGEEAIRFGPFDDGDAIALWRNLAAATGALPGIQGLDGVSHWPYRQLGRLRVGDVESTRRRRHAVVRRPRFLVRRKPARLPRRPLVFSEAEMARGGDR